MQCETIEGVATVPDGDTFDVAGERGAQMCEANGHDWPCEQVATTAVYELVGGAPVSCDVYGRDRWGRALAECFQNGESLNAALVRQVGPSPGIQREVLCSGLDMTMRLKRLQLLVPASGGAASWSRGCGDRGSDDHV